MLKCLVCYWRRNSLNWQSIWYTNSPIVTYTTLTTPPSLHYPPYATLHTLPSIRYPPYATLHTLPSIHYPPYTIYPPYTVLHTPPSIHHPPYTTLTTPPSLHHPPCTTLHSTFQGEPRSTPTHVCDLLVHVSLHYPPLLGHSADHLWSPLSGR